MTENEMQILQKNAEQGDADAQLELGKMYYYGQGVPKDNKKAGPLIQNAAKQGNEEAKKLLTEMIKETLITTNFMEKIEKVRDEEKAMKLAQEAVYYDYLEKAEDANRKKDCDNVIKYCNEMIRFIPEDCKNKGAAYYYRGLAYQNKMDTVRSISDYTDAIQLGFEGKTGFALAFFNRGVAYNKRGLYGKAIADFEMASSYDPSDRDIRDAIERTKNERLRLYSSNNKEEAKELLLNNEIKKIKEERERQEWLASPEGQRQQEEERKKQEQKEKEARETKEAAERVAKEAAEKLRRAAEQGDAEAQFKLGLMYKEGKGVPCDFEKAAELINKAAAQNYVEAKNFLARIEEENKRFKKEKAKFTFGLVLQICLCVAYFFVLYGTDIVHSPWWQDSFTFMRCLPFIIFSLAVGMVSLIFLKKSNYGSGIGILFVMILVQSITICVWRGDVGILLIYLIGRILINTLCAIPGLIFAFKEMP